MEHSNQIQLDTIAESWLPPGKRAAVCLTVDDIHPSTSRDAYEAGGDLEQGQLRYVQRLLDRHPALRITLFTTADWRATLPSGEAEPLLLKKGTMRLDRHPGFVAFLSAMPRVEVGLHGLDHVGPAAPWQVEFLGRAQTDTRLRIEEMLSIFQAAGLPHVSGMTPPGWHVSTELAQAMVDNGIRFVASARDIVTPVSQDGLTDMSGLKGVSLLYPQWLCARRLIHLPTNFQATSTLERAEDILECGGLLSIKAHIVKHAGTYTALDGLDDAYCDYLGLVLDRVASFGEDIWWTSMGEIAERCRVMNTCIPAEQMPC